MDKLLIKTFFISQYSSLKDFIKKKFFFFIFGLLIFLVFEFLIGMIVGLVFNFFVNYIPGGYLFTPKILALIFMVVFFTIFVMAFITTIPTLYNNNEIKYLLTGPYSFSQIFKLGLFKIFYFGLLGSGFILLPTLISYGIINRYGLWFVFFAILSLVFLTFYACLFGIFVSLLFTRFILALNSFFRNTFFISILLTILCFFINSIFYYSQITDEDTFSFLEDKILGYEYSNLFLPYNWFSKLLDYFILKDFLGIIVYIFFIILTLLFLTMILIKLGEKLYFQSIQNFLGFNFFKKSTQINYKTIFTNNRFLNMIKKDILITLRDPSQWSQLIVFFGLLTMYIYTLKGIVLKNVENINIITVLTLVNIGLTGFFVGAISLRFIFPNISLEGRALWILKTLPINNLKIYLSKSIFFSSILLFTGFFLSYFYGKIIGFSSNINLMIFVLLLPILVSIILIFYVMGTYYPDFKETNPSKISTSIPGFLSVFLGNIFLILIMFYLYPKVKQYYILVKSCKVVERDYFYNEIIIIWFICIVFIITMLYIGNKKFKNIQL